MLNFPRDSEVSKAWAAGLFDGEGSVVGEYQTGGQDGSRIMLQVSLSQCAKFVVEDFAEVVMRGNIYHHTGLGPNGESEIYQWVASGKDAAKVMELLLPYLNLKSKQAEIFLRLRELVVPPEERHKGTPKSMKSERVRLIEELRKERLRYQLRGRRRTQEGSGEEKPEWETGD